MALTDKLSAIGTAIRNKTGTTALMTLDEMPTEIAGITSGGDPIINPLEVTANGTYTATDCDGYSPITVNVPQDGAPTDAELTFSGICSSRFAKGVWDWFINKYGNRITTENILNANNMFEQSTVSNIPFELNFSQTGEHRIDYMFSSCSNLTSIPKINNCKPSNMDYLFHTCYRLRYLPEDIATWFDWSYLDNLTSQYENSSRNDSFIGCHSLRSIPMDFLSHGNPVSDYRNSIYYNGFQYCYALDEILNLPIPHYNSTWTYNAFSDTFFNCYRLKNVTFALNPETNAPYVVEWKKQTIDLSTVVGYCSKSSYILNYNSGITAEKEVTDDATYQALKNDPDWFTTNIAYSRYNHDSAVATINSLPDTSAYLATAGGTNTIRFQGTSGSSTDGGAINTLTEAEIAVATTKGWTVSIT